MCLLSNTPDQSYAVVHVHVIIYIESCDAISVAEKVKTLQRIRTVFRVGIHMIQV